MEDEFGKRATGETPPLPIHAGFMEDQMMLPGDSPLLAGLPGGMMERPKTQPNARPGPSSYWSVSELQDFDKNVAHFGTDWLAIANHMGTKTHTMIKNQYLRLVEGGRMELEQVAKEADVRRERGDDLGPAPTPTPAPKRRYESTQTAPIRQIAPTPEHKSPPSNPISLPKASPPHVNPSSRFSTIAQAPVHGKPSVTPSGFSTMPETSLASVPPMPPQQSPSAPPPRTQLQHHHQQSLSQLKTPQHGPRPGYFSDDPPPRLETRQPSQPSATQQTTRTMQQHAPAPVHSQEQHHSPLYRSLSYQEREKLARPDIQQEREAHRQFQHHARRISHEMPHQRPFAPGNAPPLMHGVRPNTGLRSPEHRPLAYTHARHVSQTQPAGQAPSDTYPYGHSNLPGPQQLPPRSSILTPPVKEEPKNLPPSTIPQAPTQSMLHTQHQHAPSGHATMHAVPPTAAPPKPVAEPRKSNLMSLLNDDSPEEPRRKKPSDQGPPSHTPTPQQSTPIAPPPTTQSFTPSARRQPYDDLTTSQPTYTRPSYAQQSTLPPPGTTRPMDLSSELLSTGRQGPRENWQPRQQFGSSQSQQPPSLSAASQPSFYGSHRAVFAPHNGPRHNPSPPPTAAYANSPHSHSRTPSISGAPVQVPRHSIPSTTAAQHSQAAAASAQILQPNPYAQVDPPGNAPPAGPMGMRPSPHLHTSHIAQHRDSLSRNEHSQAQNASISYSNPSTPNEHPNQPLRGSGNLNEPYRPRDPRDTHHGLESRNSDRDTSRELSQRVDYLRDQLSNPALRSTGPPLHEEPRYQPQDRGYISQRSQTPLSRSEHGQPPPLQHPPHSSLGVANHSLYGQRPPEEPTHRFSQPFPRDRNIADRVREEQAQQQVALNRDDYHREREMREREIRERDAHFRESMMRGRDMRGPPPPSAGSQVEQRQDPRPPNGPGSMDWASAIRHPQERGGWQR